MRDRLDEVDVNILRLLMEDGRITNADIARKVGLSAPSVLQRVRKLEDLGVIRGYTVVVDPATLGYSLTVMAQISLALHQEQPIDRFVRAVQEIPEVQACYHVSGEFDYLLKIVVQDMKSYEALIKDRLSKIKGIGKIHSCFVLATAKEVHSLPLEDLP
ncbi:MAG TPA: Lrp/AsnC family transcriptional regulator [Fimbriimonadaceae bacterium]|nr:Lrp/AsnC family transcriptional regulator [Fimbriimonadaceae bacterium]